MIIKKSKIQNTHFKTNQSEEVLRRLAYLEETELLQKLETRNQGLTVDAATHKLETHGPNIIVTGNEDSAWKRLAAALINPFNIVLFVVAIITFVTDVMIADAKDYATAIIIMVLILVSAAVAFIQGEKSGSAASKLSKMITNKADVLRSGEYIEIDMSDVVPGDIVKLSAGDMLPGDVRFLTTKDAFVGQSSLTGESAPVEKYSRIKHPDASGAVIALTDIDHIGFMGTNVISGSATALILATGNDTYFGSMAKSLSGDRAKNAFEQGVDAVSKLLLRFMLVMVPVIFVVNGLNKGDWGQALIFAVTMAVGLTPEMLPVIMTSTLARGAMTMAKHQTIVKNLSSIQSFGEMDILCTDKTGTLTLDEVVLEKYMDAQGNDDARILRHAYLNSYFQTGLKNLIDLAIINRATIENLEPLLNDFICVDEIPFDFQRRRMSVVLKDKNMKRELITKGAVEEVTAICKYVFEEGEVRELNDDRLAAAMRVYETHNAEGLRVIAVAVKRENIAEVTTFGVKDESDMVLIGFVGFLDPPKESAALAIDALREHGVRTIVITGDSEGVAAKVCSKVGVNTDIILTGVDVDAMNDNALKQAVQTCDLFAKISPMQKKRIVHCLQTLGHTVGYLGDGINDAPALRQADVGISVDSGVDIAKETADIILLKKDLMVLEEGVLEGRRTFGNIIKYIKMAGSGNFGNMISVLVASLMLPFLPLLPVHILVQNLLCDFSQMGIPFDHMDSEYLLKPRRWETKSIERFMMLLGPLSAVFDMLVMAILWFIIKANTPAAAPVFQAGLFVFGTLSQILITHMIRTQKVPFFNSRASKPLMVSSVVVALIALLIVFTPLTIGLDFAELPLFYAPWLLAVLVLYSSSVEGMKGWYVRKFGEWL